MKHRCAWHKRNFGFTLTVCDDQQPVDMITDTICPDCLAIEFPDAVDSVNEKNEISKGV